MKDLTNSQLGQYQLLEAVGRGGMATVYKAHQPALNRFVAVKVLHAHHDPQFAARFRREAQTIAQLQHPNILPIYDYGEEGDLLYFVVQYIEGGATLADLLGQPSEPAVALPLIGQVLGALEYAHRFGIVHRDIKPGNILLPKADWPMLADFGIAKLLHENDQLTMTGFIIGTAAYMSPEQASGQPLDGRTDLYALGIVLYEMLTGRLPFQADTPMAMLSKHVYEPPPPPRSLNPALSPALEAVVLRAIAKEANDRYQTAAEMAAALESALMQPNRTLPPTQATRMYQAGLAAFQAGQWAAAIDQLNQVASIDPHYEDVTTLLESARQSLAGGAANLPVPATPAAPVASGAPATYSTHVLSDATVWQHESPTVVNPPGVGPALNPRPAAPAPLPASPTTIRLAQPPTRKALIGVLLALALMAGVGSMWQRSRAALADSPATPTVAATAAPQPTTPPKPSPVPQPTVPPKPAAAPAAAPAPAPKPQAGKPSKPDKQPKPPKKKK